jgi:hypothetical protein
MPEAISETKLDDKIQRVIIRVIQLSLVGAMAYGVITAHWEIFFMSGLALLLSWVPSFLHSAYRFRLPVEYDLVIVAFIYASIFLGEVGDAYELFWWWDVILHTSSGLVLGFIGFLILYTLYGRQKVSASAFVLSCFVFSFGLAAGALWEIFEFIVDGLFGTNMQKNGLSDTMADLMVDAIGALIVAVAAHRYATNHSPTIIKRLTLLFLRQNPKIARRWRRKAS